MHGTHSALGYRRVPLLGADASLRDVKSPRTLYLYLSSLCCRVQANGDGVNFFSGTGGLVDIRSGTGNISVVGSTLTNIMVCAHCLTTRRVPAHRGSRLTAPQTPAQCRTACAASTRSTLPVVPPRCTVLKAHWGTAGYRWWAPTRACVACRMQANGKNFGGGLVGISGYGTTGHVSVVGSNVTNITVRTHCSA
jgi:hypothetical protein